MIENLQFNISLEDGYQRKSQKIRVLTETWMERNSYCPYCGKDLCHYPNNKPVADFYCDSCQEDFELKSKENSFGKKIVDGAYNTMLDRLMSDNNPNLFIMTYQNYEVKDLILIPKYFFIPAFIEKRKPLSSKARRTGWVGCNILLSQIPESGKIFYIRNKRIINSEEVLNSLKKITFLKDKNNDKRGWLLDVMKCIDKLSKKEFLLDEIYKFERELKGKHPNNNFIKDKIRQQLQSLRDDGFIRFKGRGVYEVV